MRSVPYQLRGAMCHYGEVPEGGAYKALITEAIAGGGGSLRWHVLDDVTVRCKGQEEMQEMLEAEGPARFLESWEMGWRWDDGWDGWGFGLECRDFFGEMFTHFMAIDGIKEGIPKIRRFSLI